MHFQSRTYANWLAVCVTAAALGAVGCGGSGGSGPTTTEDFISDNPRSEAEGAQGGVGTGGASSSGSGGTPSGGEGDGADSGDAERAIAEADIIQVKDNKLYALSQYAGLSVIDVSVKDHLKLLGRYQANGIPFEMYLRDGTVYAMFRSWGQYVYDDATQSYRDVTTSHIEALDVHDPASITRIGSFDLPGEISDSRIVGDVLYAVSFESGYCWGCKTAPNTTITSLAVADPGKIKVVNQLTYAEPNVQFYGFRRSISVTPDRMYVAGVEWDGQSQNGHSTIQVIDISDPTGLLVEGTTVEATGQIQSRWQMDEYNGVLRVVSQPGLWSTSAKPGVQTFSVLSAQDIKPLGYTEIQLPKPESLRSVRFDGARAYAITVEQKDPLFTIDLSDPAAPKQVGELEMPGWVYHMEPRGDRLLALGFDNQNPEGGLNVSLFDVSSLAAPALLGRVAFGGVWSSVAEGQDQIQKAFTILDDKGLVLVPYSAWRSDPYGCGTYESGIQLIDFTKDTLTKRGVAPALGWARRAFLHDDRLFAVSDSEVRTFNIDDRSAPGQRTALALANTTTQVLAAGDKVVRLSNDWWTRAAKLDIVAAADPTTPDPLGTLDLSPLESNNQGSEYYCWGSSFYSTRMLANGDHVYLLWKTDDWTKTHIAVIDISDAARPKITGQLEIEADLYANGYYGTFDKIVAPGEGVVQAGSTLVFMRTEMNNWYDGSDAAPERPKAWLEVVDLSDPAKPKHAATVELPEAAGHTPLHIKDTTVLTSHWVPLPADDTKVRFYLDRINVADPASPHVLKPVNVPGSLISFDGDTGRLLTVDYQRVKHANKSYSDCWWETPDAVDFEPNDPANNTGPGVCTTLRRAFKLVDVGASSAKLRATSPMEDNISFSSVLVGDDRVFASVYRYINHEPDGTDSGAWTGSELMVVGGMRGGNIDVTLAGATSEELSYAYWMAVDGQRLVVATYAPFGIGVLDTANLDAMTFEKKGELNWYVTDMELVGDTALCAMGEFGLEAIDVGP